MWSLSADVENKEEEHRFWSTDLLDKGRRGGGPTPNVSTGGEAVWVVCILLLQEVAGEVFLESEKFTGDRFVLTVFWIQELENKDLFTPWEMSSPKLSQPFTSFISDFKSSDSSGEDFEVEEEEREESRDDGEEGSDLNVIDACCCSLPKLSLLNTGFSDFKKWLLGTTLKVVVEVSFTELLSIQRILRSSALSPNVIGSVVSDAGEQIVSILTSEENCVVIGSFFIESWKASAFSPVRLPVLCTDRVGRELWKELSGTTATVWWSFTLFSTLGIRSRLWTVWKELFCDLMWSWKRARDENSLARK